MSAVSDSDSGGGLHSAYCLSCRRDYWHHRGGQS